MRHPVTPDGRYFVVRGRLWRCADPALPDAERARLVRELMRARRAIGHAMRLRDHEAERHARADVHSVKVALGERGEPWWRDGAPDYNRRMVRNTPYRDWFDALQAGDARSRRRQAGDYDATAAIPGASRHPHGARTMERRTHRPARNSPS